MARIRSIKPELRTSLTAAAWPREVRYFWVLLWGYLDDHGRGVDEPRLVKADCFPLDDDVTSAMADEWLEAFAKSGSLCRYRVGDRRYMHALNWSSHQKPSHPTDSRIPPCPHHHAIATAAESLPNDSGDAPETFAPEQVVVDGAGSREQGEEHAPADAETQETKSRSKRRKPKGYVAPRFAEFYAAYPRKKSPADAEAAWTKAVDDLHADPDVIIEAARLFAMSNKTKDPDFLPYPATWLNRRQWEDEPDRPPAAPPVITGPSEAASAAPRPWHQVRAEQDARARGGLPPELADSAPWLPQIGMNLDG